MQLPDFVENPDHTRFLSENYIVLDFESRALRDRGQAVFPENQLVLAVWQLPDGTVHRVRGNEFEMSELVQAVRRADFVVAHNAKFELQWLERCGVQIGSVLVYDTLLAEYVIGGNRWTDRDLSLDRIAKRRFGSGKRQTVSRLIKGGVDVGDIPAAWLSRYCEQDVALTARLFQAQRQELAEKYPRLFPVVYTRCLTAIVLADIELRGMQLDREVIRIKLQETLGEFNVLTAKLAALMPGVNPNSGKQLATFLYDTLGFDELRVKRGRDWVPKRTEKGQRATDADTVASLKAKTKQQREFIELFLRTKELSNELTKYLRKLDECCTDAGGLLYASIHQARTATQRLSSSGLTYRIQFQNIPRSYKRFFRARNDGWLVGEFDGAQLEFRVAVHLGRDPVGLRDIVNGTDVHAVTAGIIGTSRQDAKAHTFKPLYGGKSGTDKEREYYSYFREHYAAITRTQDRWIDAVLSSKKLVTEWGLVYYWPDTRMERSGYVVNSTAICNYPVQAFATAEIIPIALVYFWFRARAEKLKLFVVNTVHDSVVAEFPPEEEQDFRRLAKQSMTEDVYRYLERMYGISLVVPLGCGIKVAQHWGATKEEEKYEADQSLWRTNNPLVEALE